MKKPVWLTQLSSSIAIPAYRWLWFNSLFGTMRLITIFVARGWLVLELTDSPFWVGAAPAMRGVTQIILGTFSGVMLDRVNRKVALLVAEVGTSMIALSIGWLVFTGQIELWHILVASVFEGMMMSVRWPAINTMIFQAVGRDQLLNASAAQMMGFNIGNLVASAIAGVMVARFGVESGYLFAGVNGLIASVCVLLVVGEFRPNTEKAEPVITAMREGISYIRQHSALPALIILGFLMSLLGWSNLTMMPVMARDVLGADASGLGYLSAAGAAGSLLSTAFVASLGDFENKSLLILTCGLGTTIGILTFALSPWFLLSLLLVAFMHGALMAFEVTLTASVLNVTSEAMQGRVQGIYTQVFGFTWIGGVLLGSIAEVSNTPLAVGLGGVGIGLAILLMWKPIMGLSTSAESA